MGNKPAVTRSIDETTLKPPLLYSGRLKRRRISAVKGYVFLSVLLAAVIMAVLILGLLLAEVFRDAWPVLSERLPSFLSSDNSAHVDKAGIAQGLWGTLVITAFVAVVAVPIGIGAAIYLEEYAQDTWVTRLLVVNVRNLAGVPSVVYGILGIAVFVETLRRMTGGPSIIAAGLTLAILVMPIVIITTSEALRSVPKELRLSGYGLGATQWEVTSRLVVPHAMPSILTGTILAIARAVGETAPLILVGAMTGFFYSGDSELRYALYSKFTALPVLVYAWVRQPGQGYAALAAAAIVVLLAVLVLISSIAIGLRNMFESRRAGV